MLNWSSVRLNYTEAEETGDPVMALEGGKQYYILSYLVPGTGDFSPLRDI
jgi:hypothetical protein